MTDEERICWCLEKLTDELKAIREQEYIGNTTYIVESLYDSGYVDDETYKNIMNNLLTKLTEEKEI